MVCCRRFCLIVISFLLCYATYGQDASFSQFYSNQLYLNPAFAGNPRYQRAQTVVRSQWLTTHSPYMSFGMSYDRYCYQQNSGVGINIINDMQAQGALNWLTLDLQYSYNIRLAYNAQMRGGVQVGGIFKSQSTRNLIFPDMIDQTGSIVGSPGFTGKSKVMPDFAVGVAGEWGIYYGGIAVHHLLEPVESKYDTKKITVPRKYTVHAGCDINIHRRHLLRKSMILSPNVIYMQQSDYRQANVGVYLSYQNIVSGLWVRSNIGMWSNTFVLIVGYHDDFYSFAYSYDFSILRGGFRGLSTSSHEVTFGMNFQYKKKFRKKLYTIKSPKF